MHVILVGVTFGYYKRLSASVLFSSFARECGLHLAAQLLEEADVALGGRTIDRHPFGWLAVRG